MIYVCVPVHNEARTAGLVLWKVRQVFTLFPREYQLLVLDDASTDETPAVLASYAKVLPMTIVTHRERLGYARSLEELLRLALQRTDRPKRDCAITLHADFVHSPESMEDLVKHLESGADLVVAELLQQRGRGRTWCSAPRASDRGASCSTRGGPVPSSAPLAPWWRWSSWRSACTPSRTPPPDRIPRGPIRPASPPCPPWRSSRPPPPWR